MQFFSLQTTRWRNCTKIINFAIWIMLLLIYQTGGILRCKVVSAKYNVTSSCQNFQYMPQCPIPHNSHSNGDAMCLPKNMGGLKWPEDRYMKAYCSTTPTVTWSEKGKRQMTDNWTFYFWVTRGLQTLVMKHSISRHKRSLKICNEAFYLEAKEVYKVWKLSSMSWGKIGLWRLVMKYWGRVGLRVVCSNEDKLM